MLFNQQTQSPAVFNPIVANQQLATLKKVGSLTFGILAVSAVAFVPEVAFAGGLDKANSGLQQFITDAKPFIRTFAVVALMLTAAGYMGGLVDKSKFFLIAAGLLIIGAAPDIVDMFWSK